MYELGEVIPTIMSLKTADATFEDCSASLHFSFNCTSACLASQIPSRDDYPQKPLILTITAFLIKRTGEIIRPIKEFSRNFLITIYENEAAMDAAQEVSVRTSRSDTPSPDYRPGYNLLPGPSDEGRGSTRRASKRRAKTATKSE